MQPVKLSPRLQALKDDLVQRMPIKKAADRATLASKNLGEVIIEYLTWQARLIRPRRRSVIIWPEVTNSPHYPAYKNAIARIKSSFERGVDMNAYLSNQAHNNAYAANLPTNGANMNQTDWVKKAWKGKDRVRIAVDTHHLHLGEVGTDGKVKRTGPLLFVGITHDTAFLLTVGDHGSFDNGTVSKLMHDKLDADLVRAGGGAALAGPGITLSGTQVKDTFKSINIVKELRRIDADLNSQNCSALDRLLRLDWDDILVIGPGGTEVARYPGAL